jgi:hypothetical protein
VREALQSIVGLIEKSVKSKETRLQSGRLLRQTAVARRQITAADLTAFLGASLPDDSPAKAYLLGVVGKVRRPRAGCRQQGRRSCGAIGLLWRLGSRQGGRGAGGAVC